MQFLYDANDFGLKFLGIDESLPVAILGYAVVFLGLIMLMVIVYLMGAVFKAKAKREALQPAAQTAKIAATTVSSAPVIEAKTAPGSAGEVKRFDVPDKEAALIMAIVADQMGKPLNELRFKSIKEVKEK